MKVLPTKMKFNSSLLLFSGAALLSASSCQQADKQPPNVLFIIADDLGYFDLSFTGSPFYETPHTDRIAREGISFTHGYATSPVSSPSRASLMTGQFAPRHGITQWIGSRSGEAWRDLGRHNQLIPADYDRHLSFDHVTLAEAMQEAGYKTFFSGKWHLGSEGSWPTDHGFDINVGGWDSGSPIGGYFDPYENPNLDNRNPGENLSWRLADETAEFFRKYNPQQTGQPFFAYLSFYAVHGPLQTTQEKWQRYRDKAEEAGLAEYGYEMGQYLPIRMVQDNPVYAGLVEAMDDAVGHVLQALDDLGLNENTIVIFTSDQGGVSSGDGFATSNLPFRQGKGSTLEGGLRVPIFIKAPGITQQNTFSDVPATGADLYPTILDLAGVELRPNEHKDGVSLLPAIQGAKMPDRPLFWHYPHYSNQEGSPSSVVRHGDWKLIHFYETDSQVLYNLRTDISEERDLSAMYPAKAESLTTLLFDYLEEAGARYPQRDPLYDAAAERARLQDIERNRMRQLEEQRLLFLSPDFDPDNNWWGSQVD